jgi:hypothetical protein
VSRTVQRWPSAGPMFQACRPASVADYVLGSSVGSSRAPACKSPSHRAAMPLTSGSACHGGTARHRYCPRLMAL